MHDDAEVVPLFPWEERSMIRRICAPANISSFNQSKSFSQQQPLQPLQPIPNKCCIGSSSSGGQVTFQSHICNVGVQAYQQAEQHALEYLRNYPSHSSTSSTTASTATSCDVCKIVEVLSRNNWTMTFQGDSTMHQLADAFDCALRRRGYRVETDERPWRRPEGLFWRYGIGSATRMKVWPPHAADAGSKGTLSSPVTIHYYGMYRPHFGDNSSEICHVMERSDVLVFDHGLHYTIDQDKVFLSEMTKLMETIYQMKDNTSMLDSRESVLAAGKRPKVVVWKETVSQHYDTATGDYATASRGGAPDGCVQHPYLRNDSVFPPDQLSWYQDYMMRITQEMGLRSINADNISSSSMGTGDALFVLPFTQFTRPLHYLHPGGKDCTHVCYTPLVWMPIWRSLRRVLDNSASDHLHLANGHVGSTFVLSEIGIFLQGKKKMQSIGLFLLGATLLLLITCFGESRNQGRCRGKRIWFAVGFVLAIGIAAIDLDNMNSALQSITFKA